MGSTPQRSRLRCSRLRGHDDRTVAVKRLAPDLADDQEFQQRFRREAHHVARLRSPHVIPIHTYGEIDGHLFIDMRFVDGLDLAELIAQAGPLPAERAVRILEQVASALDAAHLSGLVHRDVKPSNVLIDGTVTDFCYLADFGITRLVSSERSTSLTSTGALLGSLDYMAPEQFDGEVTRQSDVYALTCMFFELITGVKPFTGKGLPALMHSHLQSPPPRPSTRNVEALFDDVVARGMAKSPDDRYGSAGELARAARAAFTQQAAPTTAHDVVPFLPPVVAPVVPRVVPPVEPAPEAGSPHVPVGIASDPDERLPADDPLRPVESPDPAADGPPPAEIDPAPDSPAPEPAPEPAPTAGSALRRHRAPLLVAATVVAVALVVGLVIGLNSTRRSSDSAAAAPVASPTTTPAPSVAAVPVPAGPVFSEAIFTGRTSGNELTLAVGVKDGRAAGYLCDGSTVEAWLEGTLIGDRLELRGTDPATTVAATVDQRSLLGTVAVRGAAQPFSAEIAAGEAGLYENRRSVAGITTRIGWIVLPDGTQVGIRNDGSRLLPAPPLDPRTLTAADAGTQIQAVAVTGATVVLG